MKMIFKILLLLAATGHISQLFAPPEDSPTNTAELERAVDALTAETVAEIQAQEATTTTPKASGVAASTENNVAAEPQAARAPDDAAEKAGTTPEATQTIDAAAKTAEPMQQKSTTPQKSPEDTRTNSRLAAYAKARTSESLGGKAKVVATAVGGGLLFAPIGIAAAMHQADKNKELEEAKLKKLRAEAETAEASLQNLGKSATTLDRYMAGFGLDPAKRFDDSTKLGDSGFAKLNRMIEETSEGPEEKQQSYNQLTAALLEDEAARRGKVFDENGAEVEGNLTPEQKARADAQFTALAEALTRPTDKLKGPSGSFGDDSLEAWNVVMKGLGLPAPTDSRQLPDNKADARQAIALALKAKALDAQLQAENLDPAQKTALEQERDDLISQAKQKASVFESTKIGLWQRFKAAVATAFGPKDRKIDDSGIKNQLIASAMARKTAVTTESVGVNVDVNDAASKSTDTLDESTAKTATSDGAEASKVRPPAESAMTQRALDAASARAKVNWAAVGAATGLTPAVIAARAKAGAAITAINPVEISPKTANLAPALDKDAAEKPAIATADSINLSLNSKQTAAQKRQADIENITAQFGFDDKAASKYLGRSDTATSQATTAESKKLADEPGDDALAKPKNRQTSSGAQQAPRNPRGALARAPELVDEPGEKALVAQPETQSTLVAAASVEATASRLTADAAASLMPNAADEPRDVDAPAKLSGQATASDTQASMAEKVADGTAESDAVHAASTAAEDQATKTIPSNPAPSATFLRAAANFLDKKSPLNSANATTTALDAKIEVNAQSVTPILSLAAADAVDTAKADHPGKKPAQAALVVQQKPDAPVEAQRPQTLRRAQTAPPGGLLRDKGGKNTATSNSVATTGLPDGNGDDDAGFPREAANVSADTFKTALPASPATTDQKDSSMQAEEASPKQQADVDGAKKLATEQDVARASIAAPARPNSSSLRAKAIALSVEERAANHPPEINASVEGIETLRQQLTDAEAKPQITATITTRRAEIAQTKDLTPDQPKKLPPLAATPDASVATANVTDRSSVESDEDPTRVPTRESSDSDPMTRPRTASIVKLRRSRAAAKPK